ncbi:MAG: hypothetical protein LLG04_04245 [Parachlamydia sp.]|nr:hypothetical protein [Parachlamydia sp.]
MDSRIEKLPFIGTFFKPEQKKGVAKSPYPAFFKDLVKPPKLSEPGKTHKAIILQGGLDAKAVRLFVRMVWGGKVLKGLQEVARADKGVNVELKNRMLTGIEKREGRLGVSEYRSDKGMAKLPIGHLRDMREDAGKTPKASSTEIAEAHLQALKETEGRCPPIPAGDGNPWRALRVSGNADGELQVTHSTICPTSERALGVSNDLTNIYFHISDEGHLSITCGVIDTETKAQQFMAAVREALIYRDGMRPTQVFPDLRISMHQLNSMGSGPGVLVSERSLVTRQHQMVDYINQHMQSYLNEQNLKEQQIVTFTGGPPYVAHVNRCLNGFTQIKGEDANAYPINREGLAIQMGWMAKDVGLLNLPSEYRTKQHAVNTTVKELQGKKKMLAEARQNHIEHSSVLRDIKKALDETEGRIINVQIRMLDLTIDAQGELDQLRNQLDGMRKLKKDLIEELTPTQDEVGGTIQQLEKEIKALDKQLEGQVKDLAVSMHDYEKDLAKDPEQKELQTKLRIATHILASQTGMVEKLDLPKLTPAQELGYQLLFDQMLNVVTEINCKSGLDRTGFARSMLNAIEQKIKNGKSTEEIATFLDNFENSVKAMDREVSEQMRRDPAFSFTQWLEGDGQRYREVYDFQASVFAELVGVARCITGRSAGPEGLKWHYGKKSINPFEKNPHPVPFIPMFIVAEGKTVPLIQVNKKGNRSFTTDGIDVLMGLSARRGG